MKCASATLTFTNRRLDFSTQIYIESLYFNNDGFYVPGGDCTKPTGSPRLKKIAKEGRFELSSLENLDYPNPHPQFSLLGALYSRQAALEAYQSLSAYAQLAD